MCYSADKHTKHSHSPFQVPNFAERIKVCPSKGGRSQNPDHKEQSEGVDKSVDEGGNEAIKEI